MTGGTGPGARIDYVELPTLTAHELTRAFYAKAFGWEFTDYGPDYSATAGGTVDVGLNGTPEDSISAPLPIVRVTDLEAAQDAVLKAGGVIARPIFAFPGGRRFHFIDPSGSELAAWQSAEE
uniref:VOC family protein n=1 Tax=uncultured Sphingomonas sp. TaxID=158754 RepID=UPI0025E99FFB|nr:VOC family protein [uncultured Sphingomonas sp.]